MNERAVHGYDLRVLPGELSISRLTPGVPIPTWVNEGAIYGALATPDELTVICSADAVPSGVRSEKGWRCLQVRGPLAFTETGVLAALSAPLAASGVSIFVLSTFDTDYILVRSMDLSAAIDCLREAGHRVIMSG